MAKREIFCDQNSSIINAVYLPFARVLEPGHDDCLVVKFPIFLDDGTSIATFAGTSSWIVVSSDPSRP